MRRNIMIAVILILLVAASGFLLFQPVSVNTTKAAVGPAALFVYASGQVIPEEKIILRSKTVARIIRFLVEEGQSVSKGDLLVTLEGDEISALLAAARSELAQARTDLDFKKRDYDRVSSLYQQQAVSQREHDTVLTTLRSAENTFQRAQANVAAFAARSEDYSLTSPFNGFILEKLLDTGAMVTNTDPILTLATAEAMLVEGKVDELDAGRVKLGQKVLMTFDSLPGTVYEGVVQTLAPRIDYATKSFKIKISIPPDIPVRAGMSAELNILVQEKQQALLIPASALSENFVWMEKDGRARKVKVKTGLRDTRKVEIIEGIKEGDAIIDSPSGLSDNQRIRINSAN